MRLFLILFLASAVDGFMTSSTFVGSRRAISSSSSRSSIRMDMEGGFDDNTRRMLELKFSEANLYKHPVTETMMNEAEHAYGMPWRETIGSSEYQGEAALLYMPFWEWQMSFMKKSLTNLRPSFTKKEYGFKENTSKKARIVSHCFESDEYRKIRMTYYDAGDNTQVFNSVWYPNPEYNLPILGVDILAFNRKKYLAIVDFQPLYKHEENHDVRYEHFLRPIKERYNSLKGRMSSKFYDETKFFSQQMLFSRFEDESVITKELFPAFQRYVETHVDLIQNKITPNFLNAPRVLERQRAYDTYSAERDPATGLFAAMFGKEWADNFVYKFLFSLCEPKEGGATSQIPHQGNPMAQQQRAGDHVPKPQHEVIQANSQRQAVTVPVPRTR